MSRLDKFEEILNSYEGRVSGEPIVVEFTLSNSSIEGEKYYFIGVSLEDILKDTNQGKNFGWIKFSSRRVISLDGAKELKLGFYEDGYKVITEKLCKSYKLGESKKKNIGVNEKDE
jgi:hypothetical protein